MKIKETSTGNNDSVEDALIAIMNIKTEDGKLVNFGAQIKEALKGIAITQVGREAIREIASELGEENE